MSEKTPSGKTPPGETPKSPENKAEKNAGRGQGRGEQPHRFRLSRFFEKLDLREEARFIRFGKRALMGLLLFLELLIILRSFGEMFQNGRWISFLVALAATAVLSVSEAVKLFAVKDFRGRVVCYSVDLLAVFTLTAATGSTYLCALYMIILTEFYVWSEKFLQSAILCAVCMLTYLVSFGGASFFLHGTVHPLEIVTQSFYDLIVLLIHFLFVNFSARFYRQYIRLSKTLKELDESKAELQKAYDELAEITILEERQRIAKDIHDTAGHSITTVIMQTEAAKLIVDSDPAEAKNKIIAANLQAKHALEELRDSVHLLSGVSGKQTLREALVGIVNESTDGTGIKIRYDVDDVAVCDSKYRFICNTLKEGISNGLRHGRSTAFWFELKYADGKISFVLSDNGLGVEMDKLKEGFGLSAMSARAESLGGELWFVSEPDEGFEIHLVLPADAL